MTSRRAGLMLLTTTVLLTGAQAPADPVTYEIDRSHTNIGFVVRHMVVTNVRGQFNDFSGSIVLNEQDVTKSRVSVVVKTGSIDTSHERRDADLRGEDFFDAERFPELKFTSRRIERTADGLVAVGDLTIRDVTKEVRIPFELTGPINAGQGVRRLGVEGAFRINRQEYGLRWNRMMEAGPVVADEVRIELAVEAISRPAQ
jgi:polyisoprenoid-binding protein YceI